MTREKAEYLENKYRTFIKIWQTSNSVNEVCRILHDRYGWHDGMETDDSYYHRDYLSLRCARNYAWRLRKKGVQLKEHRGSPIWGPDHAWAVDYTELNKYSQQTRRAG